MTTGYLLDASNCFFVCSALHHLVCFLLSVCFFQLTTSTCIELMFKLSIFNAAMSGIPSSAWPFPGTTKNTSFFEFLNLIVTVHVPCCVICVPLYVFNFMLLFMEPFSCSYGIFLNSFLNIYWHYVCPLLPVSILYGISVAVSPTCIFRCAVINDQFLFRYIEIILTISMSSSWGSGVTSPSTS